MRDCQCAVRREWGVHDLIASWTQVDADLELLAGTHDTSRLSCALKLKFFEIEGLFPRCAGEVSPAEISSPASPVA